MQIKDVLKEAIYDKRRTGIFIDQRKLFSDILYLLLKQLERKVSQITHPHDVQKLDSSGFYS